MVLCRSTRFWAGSSILHRGVEAVITGSSATKQGTGAWDICRPLVVLTQKGQEAEGWLGEVRLTADSAEVDVRSGTIELSGSVKAEGSDFDIAADDVKYVAATSSISSTSPVEVNRYRLGARGTKTLAMKVNGTGMDVDIILKKVVCRSGWYFP